MEVRNRGSQAANHAAYHADTRVYSPTRGSSAYAYAQAAEAVNAYPLPEQQPQAQPTPRQRPQVQQRPRQRYKAQLSAGVKASLVVALLIGAVSTLFVIFRYHTIATQYGIVNDLRGNIETTQRRISELNVELECAVSIQSAQDAAQKMGLAYPELKQYVRVGETLVLDTRVDIQENTPGENPEEDPHEEPEMDLE